MRRKRKKKISIRKWRMNTNNNNYCKTCVHSQHNKCLLGNRVPYPPTFCCDDHFPNTHIFQLQQKHVKTVRKKLLIAQNFICPICGKEIDSPVLDHHHKKRIKGTGQIRGVLCRTCNVLLAKAENNANRYAVSQKELPNVLRNMANYLESNQYSYYHPSEKEKPLKLKKSSYNKLKKAHDAYNKRCAKLVAYPKSGNLTLPLKKLFTFFKIQPEFYSTGK